MAATTYGASSATNDREQVKLWSRKLFREALKQTWCSKFMGTTSNSLCQILEDTQKGPGDRIRFILRMQLTGTGISGDTTLEGNEEALTTFTDNVVLDQLRHAVRSGGKMSEQRIPFSVRDEARMGLQDWWADRIDTAFFNQLAGNTAQADLRYSGGNATITPSLTGAINTNRYLIAGGQAANTVEASLTVSGTVNRFVLSDIDRAVALARTTTPPIRPIMVNGDPMYVLFLHPYTMYQLRTGATSTVGNYVDLFKAAMQGGVYKDNPIMTGASFVYNNTIVHEAVRVPNTVTANNTAADQSFYRRNIFCGAQAIALAFGQDYDAGMKMSWVEELFDYENQLGVSAGMIWGMKKAQFTSAAPAATTAVDFGTIVISSWSPQP